MAKKYEPNNIQAFEYFRKAYEEFEQQQINKVPENCMWVNKDKYIEYKTKAELYDNQMKQIGSLFNIRGGGIYQDFTNYLEAIKCAKMGKLSIYLTKDINLVILPKEMFDELVKDNDKYNNTRNR